MTSGGLLLNTLILLGNMDWLGLSMKATKLVDVARLYRNCSKLSKPFFRLHHHIPFFYHQRYIWYGRWKRQLGQYDTIILFDVFEDVDIIKYIRDKYPHIRLIVYYYNTVYNKKMIRNIKKINGVEIWSFDKKDCIKYQLRYNPQFYFHQLNFPDIKLKNVSYTSDVFFVGKDKGRLLNLMEIDKNLQQAGIQTKFIVVRDRKQAYTESQRKYMGKHISYAECIEYVKNTNCILDMVQSGQKGMTLRIMEAMFFNKKIISNNDDIMQMDFYDPSNIYIIGKDHRSLSDFILENKSHWPVTFVHEYSFETWLANFQNGEE